jgi:hypothetical protein
MGGHVPEDESTCQGTSTRPAPPPRCITGETAGVIFEPLINWRLSTPATACHPVGDVTPAHLDSPSVVP